MVSIRQSSTEDKDTLVVLMEELQDYLVQIDTMKRLRRLPGWGKKYTNELLKKIKKEDGVIFIAELENIPLGFVAGILNKQNKDELLGCVPTKSGRVAELIVSEKHRNKNVGKMLMSKIEEYFKQQNCDVIQIEVFGPNNRAYDFYKKLGYSDRDFDMIKKI